MDEQRVQAYFHLIDELLSCTNEEEILIIKANQTLIDMGLIETMNQVAKKLTKQGNNNGKWLKQFSKKIAYSDYNLSKKYFDFIIEAQKIIVDGLPQSQIYHFFQENLDAIDLELSKALQIWTNQNILDLESREKYVAGCAMYSLAYSLENFSSENKRNILEISLTGYNIALKIFAKVNNPLNWAKTSINIASIYRDRIEGVKRDNIEQEIAAYSNALQVYTKEDFPVDWAYIQHNLAFSYGERVAGDKRENTKLAINHCQAALEIYTQEEFSVQWAMIQYNLGKTYTDIIEKNKANNLEVAISAYEKALKIYTQQEFSVQWAMTQNNLGLAYKDRIKGDKAQNIEVAISAYEKALEIYTQKEFPVQWAMTQNNLGLAYKGRIRGDKARNIEAAISAYEQALIVYTQQDYPLEWATIQNNLGAAYNNRIKGNKAQNLEASISAYEQALIIRTQQNYPVEWAGIQNNLGIAYGHRIKGDKAQNLEAAISAFEQALIIRTQQDLPLDWATTQNNLGAAYRNRIKGDKAQNLEAAISACEQALIIYTQQEFPEEWAGTQNNLGVVYSDRIKGGKIQNIELAIAALQQALTIYNQEDFPEKWAETQNNLGITYNNRIKGGKAQNIELAIAAYRKALTIKTKQNLPFDWAETQNNLGTAYNARIKGDKAQNIELAIAAYRKALTIRTKQNLPFDWAETQSNLGAAYTDRIKGDKADNTERAIEAYEQVLKVYTLQNFPVDWANAQNNLGNAYSVRTEGNRANNIEEAIFAFKRALIVQTQTDLTTNTDCARTQNNLGITYIKRIKRDRASNIEQSISAFRSASKVYTKQDFPVDWARTQNNIGIAYSNRIKGDKAQNIANAVAAYKEALTLYTPLSDPFECLRTARNLGNLHFKEGNWQQAVEAYSLTIKAVEQSREWAANEENKQEVISNAIEVYQNIVQCCINLGQNDKAIEYVERGKARNLVDLLSTRDLYSDGNIPQSILNSLHNLRRNITIEQKRLRQLRISNQNNFGNSFSKDNRSLSADYQQNLAQNRERLNSLYKSLDFLIETHILPVDPSFELTQIKPISFSKIRQTLPSKQTVIVEWFIDDGTLSAFIVTAGQNAPIHMGYSEEQFDALVDSVDEYYTTYRQRDKQWDNNLPQLLASLAQHLQLEDIIEQIKEIIPDCNQLILVPHRWLHLLPIHALPLSDGKCLLDLFPKGVSYAPSVQLLQLTQKQSRTQLNNLFAVQNPTEDLEFTNIEVTAISSQFTPNDDVLIGESATRQALTKQRLAEVNLAHFSCHGYFNFENPELSALLMAGSQLNSAREAEAENNNQQETTRYLPSREGGSIDLEKCLTLGEIFGLDLGNCRLVTLSACETGITDFRSLSDEYIGLPSGFLFAGSPSVVSSLWAVSDISTSFLMIKFYQNLQHTDSVAVALNKAQLWLRDATREDLEEWLMVSDFSEDLSFEMEATLLDYPSDARPYASPYQWAAFCAVGS